MPTATIRGTRKATVVFGEHGRIGEAGRQLINTGTVNYRVLGDVTVSTPLGNFTRPYDQTGRFSTLSGRAR